MNNPAPIGVFDSGIGGLTVVRELMRQLPNESIIYFGDTARLPYGPKSPDTVLRYSREITDFLKRQARITPYAFDSSPLVRALMVAGQTIGTADDAEGDIA